METTAVIHRTRWVEHECSGSVCFVLGRIGSYVAVCPSFVFLPAPTRRTSYFRGDAGDAGDAGDSGDKPVNIGVRGVPSSI